MPRKPPEPGTVLHCDDGVAIVVIEGTSAADALIQMVRDGYGGLHDFSPTNPAIVEAVDRTRVEIWRSCTRKWQEAEMAETGYDDWWAPHGDGARQIWVAWYDGSAYSLGEAALVHEPDIDERKSVDATG